MQHTLKNGIIIDVPEPHLGVSPWVIESHKVGFSLTWNFETKRFELVVNGLMIEPKLFEYYNRKLKEMQDACNEANEIYQNLLNKSK